MCVAENTSHGAKCRIVRPRRTTEAWSAVQASFVEEDLVFFDKLGRERLLPAFLDKAGILIAYGRDAPYQPAAGRSILTRVYRGRQGNSVAWFLLLPIEIWVLLCYNVQALKKCGVGISVLLQLPKLARRVRLPYPAPSRRCGRHIVCSDAFYCAGKINSQLT